MSAIAEWYIVQASDVPALTAACQPVKRLLRAPARDYEAFWQFLGAHASTGEGLDASGWVMNPLLELLRERFDVPVGEAEAHPLTKTIAIDTILIIEPAVASKWIAGLDAAIADRDDLTTYLKQWYGDAEPTGPEEIELHAAGLRYLRDGIARLRPGAILLFSIG